LFQPGIGVGRHWFDAPRSLLRRAKGFVDKIAHINLAGDGGGNQAVQRSWSRSMARWDSA